MPKKSKSRILKVLILGEHSVGKTSLINRYVNEEYYGEYKPTIGVDFCRKDVEINGQTVTMQIWDTAGQERFQALSVPFYRGADCCVLVFDCTNQNSFHCMNSWRNEFLLHANPVNPVPFALLANKIDLVDEREVTKEEAEAWSQSMSNKMSKVKMSYYETSAKDGTNVHAAFMKVAEDYLKEETFEIDCSPNCVDLNRPSEKRSWCF